MSRYLNEVRLGKQKQFFRDIIRDVRGEFGLSSTDRPVPHITLFGPYNTNQGHEVKERTQDVLAAYRVVPFQVTGFGSFTDSGVVYAEVEPSEQLQELRRDLTNAIDPVTYNYRPWDSDNTYDFHITIATNLGRKRTRVLDYVSTEYDVNMELYAKRVAALDGRNMMWEWDLPRGIELSSRKATSKESWEKTVTALNEQTTYTGDGSSTQPTEMNRLLRKLLPWNS